MAQPPVAGHCPECGKVMLPVLPLSPCGHHAAPIETPLEGTGEVYSWTRAWSGDSSTLMAMVDFLDGGLRVTAPVRADSVAIGDRVRAEVGTDTPVVFMPAD